MSNTIMKLRVNKQLVRQDLNSQKDRGVMQKNKAKELLLEKSM